MSAVEEKPVPKDCAISCSVKKTGQSNGRRSFIVTVDDNGKVEVSPSVQCEPEVSLLPVKEQSSPKIRNANRKSSRGGKQRLRLAVLEENAGSSDNELANGEDKNSNDMISIDAQSLETMHDRFVKIYNKKLRGKPSFVVLEDALVRKRMEQTLQGRAICHNHAEQQTSPCDIGANTGSQTDEFLLQCALRSSMLKGHSRGCQATDVAAKTPECGACAARRSSMSAPPLRRLSQMCAQQLEKLLQAETAAAKTAAKPETAPHVTISFVPVATQTATNTVNAQPQQQPLLMTATTLPHSNSANCCAHQNNNSCCQPMTKATHCQYCQPAAADGNNYSCCLRQQQQQLLLQQQQQQQQQQMQHMQQMQQMQQQQQQQHHFAQVQQQHPVAGPTYTHCCSSCCLLRPTMAQTALGFGQAPAMPNYCSHSLLLPPPQTQPQEYPLRGWPPQPINSCLYYPMPAVSMSTYDIPHCASCHMQRHSCAACYNDYQQQHVHHLQKQQKQFVCLGGSHHLDDPRSSSSTPEHSSTSEVHVSRRRSRQHKVREATVLSEHADSELHTSASQLTVRRVNALGSSEKNGKKVQPLRNKAGAAIAATKVYMARFGRTCLVLKPTSSAMPTRLLTKRISRYTSVMAWPHKMARK